MKMFQKSGYLLFAVWVLCGLVMAQERVVIRGGTLVDVRDGSLMPNTTVVVEGDRIAAVTTGGGQVPQGGTVIDATGKYILPGLIDLHMHYDDYAPELYLNHGVTTIGDLGADHEWMKAQKDGIEKGFIPGPRMFIGTNNLDGIPEDLSNYFLRPYVHLLKGTEEAIVAMRRYIEEEVDAVKIYNGLSVEQLRVIVREANRANIPVIGHFRDVRIAAEVGGGHGIEHLTPVVTLVADRRAYERSRQASQRRGPEDWAQRRDRLVNCLH